MNYKTKLKIRDFILKFLNVCWNTQADFDSLRKAYRRSQFTDEIRSLLLGALLALDEDEKAIELIFPELREDEKDIVIEVKADKPTKHFSLLIDIKGIGAFAYERTTSTDWKIAGIDKEKETHDRANNYPELSIPQEQHTEP